MTVPFLALAACVLYLLLCAAVGAGILAVAFLLHVEGS